MLSFVNSKPSLAARNQRKVALSRKNVSVNAVPVVTEPPKPLENKLEDQCVNSIRFLAIDAVNKANSGHPGAPMGLAPVSYILWGEEMKYNPKNPDFVNRDRFILSAGHASMLLYSLLYLTGFDSVTIDDIKQFRQTGSNTPGHPENFVTKGIEVTTGPLGQGLANAVGIAAAEAHLAARFNKPDCAPVIDHYTYVLAGDGCNMEGVTNEACSLGGHWGLGKLICFYDDNEISIDGDTDISFTEDVPKRFEALGWHVVIVEDGNTDMKGIRDALVQAKSVTDKPSMIVIKTYIGYGSPNKANSYAAHGAPLGQDESDLTRKALGWPHPEFEVPDEAMQQWRRAVVRGADVEAQWEANFKDYCAKYPNDGAAFKQLMSNKPPAGWEAALPSFTTEDAGAATRVHSQTMINACADALPGFIGGSADLAGSNLTIMKQFGDFLKGQYAERNLRFGVREHAMGSICNGIGLYNCGLIPYCATFFVFTDYMRAAIRMSALSQVGVIYVMTHDSIGLGEDGPTHQPIEHLASFRAMPNVYMMRPCGGNESAAMYEVAVNARKTPSILAMSRQGMPNLAGCTKDGAKKGGYTVVECEGTPDVILMGTGTELPSAVEAGEKLTSEGKKVRVVSLPCWELFEQQSQEYRDSVLTPSVKARVSIEAGSSFGWMKYVGENGKCISVDGWGASGPAPQLYEKFGITADAVAAAARELL